MYKRLVYLILAGVVLSVVSDAAYAGALVAHWKLDDGSGAVARDSSGSGRNGTVGGKATWIAGQVDGALDFDGTTTYIDVDGQIVKGTCSVLLWLKPRNLPFASDYRSICHNDAWDSGSLHGHLRNTTSLFNFDINGGGGVTSTTAAQSDEWYHLAGTFDVGASESRLYVNGTPEAVAAGLAAAVYLGPLNWGAWTNNQRFFPGVMDDIRIYNRVLSERQLQDLIVNKIEPNWNKAEKPNPADGATGVTMPLIQWSRGETALWHDVYLGTAPELTAANQIGFRMQLQTTMIYYPATTPGTTYYWRVDEVAKDGTVYTGDVWTFTMAPLTAYAPNPRNGDKWIDPNVDPSWLPGQGAGKHVVYFGTDQAAVAARDAGVSKGELFVTTLELPKLAPQTTYYWVVDEVGVATHEGQVWSFTTAGGGGGVKGEYFANTSRNIMGAPSLTRIDPEINFNWGDPGGPGAPIGVDNFSARWTADLEIAVADTYTFITTSDDGARLWLDDALIVDSWVDQGATDHSSLPQQLEPGIYSLRMEYYEATGGAVAQLSWQTPAVPRQVVPPGPLQPPVRARAIYPKDDDANVPQDLTLMWSTGEKAVTHNIYFGEDEAAVAAATPADAGICKGSQALENNSWTPGDLEWGKTYYWRIDEINDAAADSPWKSAVWSFTTADFLVVEDFESYTDEITGRIFQTWIDGWGYTEPAPGNPGNGTGSTVGYTDPPFAEHSIVRGGSQSMPLGYNNADDPFYSETERTFSSPQNWTVNGVDTLSLRVRGYPAVTSVAVTEAGGKMTLAGGGTDIWGNSDQFTFAFKILNGDGSIAARVTNIGPGDNTWAKGGVMIRDSLDGGSAFADMVLSANSDGTAGNGAAFQWRLTADAGAAWDGAGPSAVVTPPYWVKIERFGDSITGYLSADGASWQPLGTTQTIEMAPPVYIGICVTSHVAGAERTFDFDGIKTAGGVSGTWQGAVIASSRYNDIEDLYIAVEDSTGKMAVVRDATAVNAADWFEVKTPLSSFTGVNMTKVKKLLIGVGDRDNPVADGTGMLFIDDIRVIKE